MLLLLTTRHLAFTASLCLFVLTSLASAGPPKIEPAEYRARRKAVAESLAPDSMLILSSSEPARRNGDEQYPFRQDDDLYYLTGVHAPNTTLILLPGEKVHREVLFALDRDVAKEVYTGSIAEHTTLSQTTGISEVLSETLLDPFLKAAFEGLPFNNKNIKNSRYCAPPSMPAYHHAMEAGKANVYLLFNRHFNGNPQTTPWVDRVRSKYPEVHFRDVTSLIFALRETKSPREIQLIQHAVDISLEAHKAALRRIKSASFEYQIQATVEFTFRDRGADGPGYPSIVGSGINATTLHLPTQDGPIVKDGLLMLDAGAEVNHYSADISSTFPANGQFSKEQKAIYEAVYRTNRALLPLYKPKNTLLAITEKAFALIGHELLTLGLITNPDSNEQIKLYFMHGMIHHIGLAVHDAFNRSRPLEPSMIVTNEPGIYVNAERIRANETWKNLSAAEKAIIEPALKKYDGIGVRIEDDILVTSGEPKNLSAALPRTVSEIEKFMNL